MLDPLHGLNFIILHLTPTSFDRTSISSPMYSSWTPLNTNVNCRIIKPRYFALYVAGMRRKVVKRPKANSAQDDKKLQAALKKLNVQPIPGVEEVNMFQEDGNVLHFTAPKGTHHSISGVPPYLSLSITVLPLHSACRPLSSISRSLLTTLCLLTSPRRHCRQHLRHLRPIQRQRTHRARSRYPEPTRPRLPRLPS